MFRISAETCNAFTLAEILIMAATNIESNRLSGEGDVRAAAAQSKHVRHCRRVPNAPQF